MPGLPLAGARVCGIQELAKSKVKNERIGKAEEH
jgi:hypothetical protein